MWMKTAFFTRHRPKSGNARRSTHRRSRSRYPAGRNPFEGRVEYFDAAKGYGFIRNSDNGEKYFFHITQAPAAIAEGNRVTFELERGTRGMNAVRVAISDK